MSVIWHGNLCNSIADVAIDGALLVLTICAYVPQIMQIRSASTSRGISTYYVLFNVLFSNAQLSDALALAAYAWPTTGHPVLKEVSMGRLTGLPALGGVLGLLQIFVQWSCSILVLASLVDKSQHARLSGKHASIIGFLHAAVVLFPIVSITLPRPSRHTWEITLCGALIHMSNTVVALCFVVLQFYAQFLELRAQNGSPGAISLLSLGLQMLTIGAIAFRWSLRLGEQTERNLLNPFWYLYQWAFPAVNYACYALGCTLLLACYCLVGRETAHQGALRERIPLLA